MNELNQKLKELSKCIQDTKEFQSYKKANDALEKDIKARKLLYTFQDAQRTLAIFMQNSFPGVDKQKKKVSELNNQFQKNTTLIDWINTQNELQSLLNNLVDELKEEIDFSFTNSGGGCCG